jgi:ribosomal-protein-alanine N-acetyltransferase
MVYEVFNAFPVIDLDSVILRELTHSDAEKFYAYMNDPMVKKYLSDDDIPLTLAHAERDVEYWRSLFHNKRSIYWAIAKRKGNELIGTCGFNSWSMVHKRAEISYDLSRKEWGKGIMSKSVQAICDFAFISMRVNRIQATVAHDNILSIKLLERHNFAQEGLLKQYGMLHNKSVDFYMYGLTIG